MSLPQAQGGGMTLPISQAGRYALFSGTHIICDTKRLSSVRYIFSFSFLPNNCPKNNEKMSEIYASESVNLSLYEINQIHKFQVIRISGGFIAPRNPYSPHVLDDRGHFEIYIDNAANVQLLGFMPQRILRRYHLSIHPSTRNARRRGRRLRARGI